MKLLIAEDEALAREGLKQLIPPMFTEVRTFANGHDALVAALEMKPDVVLCDVRMPKMNGIELARQLRLRFSNIHILFISAYSDKEYLKSAISLQADGYLEKPIDETELLDYLNRICAEIQAKRSRLQQQDDLADLFARQQLLRALLRRDNTQQEVLTLNPQLTDAVLHANLYLPICIRMQWPDDNAFTQYSFFSERKLAEMLGSISPDYLFASLSENQLGLLFYGEAMPEPCVCRRQLLPLLEAILKANPQVLNVCACVGAPATLPTLYPSYHAAHMQARWMGFAGASRCSVCIQPSSTPSFEDRSTRFEALLQDHMLTEAKQLIRTQTEEIIQQGSGRIDAVRRYYELLLTLCLRAGSVDPACYRNTKSIAEVISTFAKLSTLSELCRFICVRIDDISPSMNFGSAQTGITRDVQEYIRQNLSDPNLCVQSIADSVGLSENYLGALFKRETGQTLHKVIVDLRIERAKYLLLNKCRVPEVAQRCGFSSTGYFHSVFKKQTGFSPVAFIEHNHSQTGNRKDGE